MQSDIVRLRYNKVSWKDERHKSSKFRYDHILVHDPMFVKTYRDTCSLKSFYRISCINFDEQRTLVISPDSVRRT